MDNYSLKINRIKLDQNKRIICISDIHGGYDLLQNLLKKINYSNDDYLFIIGDIIEKGPDSLKTLNYVMELSKRDNVYVLIGNNDLICIDILFDQYLDYMPSYVKRCKSIYHDFASKLNIPLDDTTDFKELNEKIRDNFSNELNFVLRLPTIIETEKLLFAHASITDYNNLENLNPLEVLRYDYFMRKDFYLPKRLIVGHYPSVAYAYGHCYLRPITDYNKNITSIDGGYTAKIGGQLNAFIFENEKTLKESWDYVDNLPKALCTRDVKGIDPSIICIWDREEFSVLEKGKRKSLCLVNNEQCMIPNEFLFFTNDKYYCADYTNEIIPLKKGETVGIVAYIDEDVFIKKEDVLGFCKVNDICLK